jgi:hypothetical protein
MRGAPWREERLLGAALAMAAMVARRDRIAVGCMMADE